MNYESAITSDYVEALLWSSYDEADELTGGHSDEFTKRRDEDCAAFLARASKILERYESEADDSQIGHDFALTRNGHGAGFWDRPQIYGEKAAKLLSKLSKRFGEVEVYTGDDGKIYL